MGGSPLGEEEDALASRGPVAPTVNISRKATYGLSHHQMHFDPHILRYEVSKPLRMPCHIRYPSIVNAQNVTGFRTSCSVVYSTL